MKEEQFPADIDAKTGYLTELRRRLTALPEEEREAALTYYEEYFDDAGPEASERVLNELGPAGQLAEQILSGYSRDYLDATPHSSSAQVPARPEDAARDRLREEEARAEEARRAAAAKEAQTPPPPPPPPRRSGAATILIILLVILALPLLIPLFGAVLGLGIGAVAMVFGLTVGLGALVLAAFVTGIVLLVAGLGLFITHTLAALVACGAGLALLGLGLLLMILCVFIFGKLIPALFRLLVQVLRWPFERRVARV